MAPYVYRPTSHSSRRSRSLAENPSSHIGRSPQAIETELRTLQQEVQRLYEDIQDAKGIWPLLYFLLCPPLRLSQLRQIAAMRTRIQALLERMCDLKDQQVASLFLTCWQEELDAVPASMLMGAQQGVSPVAKGGRDA